jgi:ABC-type sulfate/molybdate transport systems ATPase subunit
VGASLSIRALVHRRGRREVLRLEALDVAANARLGVIGPNGAGKTTLVRLLAGLTAPSEGDIRLDGARLDPRDVSTRRRIAYAAQRPALLTMTVQRNVEMPLALRRVPRLARAEQARRALGAVRADHLAGRPAHALSAGEAQRVSLARALVTEPAVLLLDEPTAFLDVRARDAFVDDLVVALERRPTTAVLVSHRPDEVSRFADRVLVLDHGRSRQDADPETIMRAPADAATARLIGYENLVDAEIDDYGRVLVAGRPTGIAAAPGRRAVTVAVWAQGVLLVADDEAALAGTVASVTLARGRREVRLEAGALLIAARPLAENPPGVGDRVGISIDPAMAVVLDGRTDDS